MIIEYGTLILIIGVLIGVIAKYVVYEPSKTRADEQKASNDKLAVSIKESNDKLSENITTLATEQKNSSEHLAKSISELAIAIGELKTFTAVQNEKNINDKEKFDVLFDKHEKYEATLSEQSKAIERNRIDISAAEGSLKGLWKAHYVYTDKVDNHQKAIENLKNHKKDKENV